MSSLRSFQLAGVITQLAIAAAAGQAPAAKPAKLIGLVRAEESKEPIVGAEIQIASGPGALSGPRGLFRLDSIAPGDRKLIIRKIGYAPLEITWPFAAGDSVVRIFEMATIQTLDSVVTTGKATRDPGMDDFEMHRKLGMGHFYVRADLEKAGGQTSNLLAMTSGVKMTYGAGTAAFAGTSRGPKRMGSSICLTDVYLDNMLVYGGPRSPPFNVNSIPLASIEAIEFYAGAAQIPAKYMRLGTSCGVLVIHTRRP